jgi:Pyruvate/2-oxoacid:ferredoxin oxidoreductase delta subunit
MDGLVMKNCIYYFTGTGNSLAAAKRILEGLEDCGLVSIASFSGQEGAITSKVERVGIVCPVYDMGLPAIVAKFARRLETLDDQYVFAVLTMGGVGASALNQLHDILKGKGHGLDAAWTVRMPGNFVPLYPPPAGEKREKILSRANEKIAKITELIIAEEHMPIGFSPFSSLLRCLLYPPFIRNVHRSDEQFWVTDECTSCETCEKVCPMRNIELVDGKPTWKHHCQLCMACLHLCPEEAIQWGKRTQKRGRYRHPALTVHDMECQQRHEG